MLALATVVLAVLVALLTLTGCGEERQEPMTAPSKGGSVTLIGDSQVERGPWAELLGRPVDNRGVSGLEIAEVSALVDQSVAPGASHVVVWAGTNDVARHGVGEVETDMAELLAAVSAQAPDAEVLVLTVPPLPGYAGDVQRANTALATAAAGAGAAVVDVSDVLAAPGRMHEDGVHLSEAGYAAVGELLGAALEG